MRGDRAKLVTVDRIARRYGQRPSELIGVEDPWVAWEIDLAVMKAGCDADAEERAGDGMTEPGGDAIDVDDAFKLGMIGTGANFA